MSSERWGNIVRKLNIADGAYIDDTSFALPEDGQSVDMYKLRRPNILQTNFYGANVFSIERSYLGNSWNAHLRALKSWQVLFYGYRKYYGYDRNCA